MPYLEVSCFLDMYILKENMALRKGYIYIQIDLKEIGNHTWEECGEMDLVVLGKNNVILLTQKCIYFP